MPTMAPITQLQAILPTAAAMARPITMSAAIGVAIVSVNWRSEFAPVLKGEACANADAGMRRRTPVGGQRADRSLGAVMRPTARPLELS